MGFAWACRRDDASMSVPRLSRSGRVEGQYSINSAKAFRNLVAVCNPYGA